MEKPSLEKIPHSITVNGDTRIDNYYWLNQRENPKVIEYLKAENAYADEMMRPTEDLQNQLFEEIVGRIKQEDMSVPVTKNGYSYYSRYEKDMEYPIYCRKKILPDALGDEEVLLDGYEMSRGYSFFDVGGYSISPDNKLIAYSIDTVSRRQYHNFIKDIA